jgi:hypothetical protein
MRYKFCFGLWGVDGNGRLSSPNATYIIKLPTKLAFAIHRFLYKISHVGLEGDVKAFGIFPEYETFYNIVDKEVVICRIEYLYFMDKKIKVWNDYIAPQLKKNYKKIKIKCELNLK